jgi:hypothetical protein
MAYQIFTASTVFGRFDIAIQVERDAFPGDARANAYNALFAEFGRCSTIIGDSHQVRRLSNKFEPFTPRGCYGFIAKIARSQ